MRTERFRWVLNAVGSAAPKWFASEKQHIENKSVGLLVSQNHRTGALFAFQDRSRAAAQRGESKRKEE